jgi:hypothetical protein
MAALKRTAYIVTVAVCLVVFPCGVFGEFEKNPIIHSAKGALAALKRLQTRCEVGLSYSEYARALGDMQYEINELDEHFAKYAEKAPTRRVISLYFDASTYHFLADLHYIMSLHEIVEGWWKRRIQKQDSPVCLDLMFSDEWEEITLLLEDAGEYLERMK